MNNEQYTLRMSDEISRRLKSDAWNFQIASGVFAQKRRSNTRNLFASTFSVATAAAALIVAFLFGIKTETNMAGYERFITQQVAGTSYTIAGEKQTISEKKAGIQEVVLQNDTDTMIEETLALR